LARRRRGFTIVPLIGEEVFLVGRPGSFPFARSTVRPKDMARVPLVLPGRPNASRRLLDSLTARRGISLDVRMEVDDTSIIKSLLKAGVGFSLLSQGSFLAEVQHGDLQALPFRPQVSWPLALVRTAEADRPEIVGALARMIRETVRDLCRSGAWPGQHLDH
jgi:LysR family transcriptional regulator, nitrogen assimilation regulatory protein